MFQSSISKLSEGSIEDNQSHLLFYNHITPQNTTGLSPAELLQGRCLRSRFDLFKADLNRKIEKKHYFDSHKRLRSFEVGQPDYVCNFGQGRKLLPEQILQSAYDFTARWWSV